MDQLDTPDRNKKLFPQKMWDLIHDERYQFCLRWSGDGQLVYLNRDEFEESYLKKSCNQFNTQKSISFVRQMNMYGFRKVDDCYYENDNFKRDCYHLLKNMIRRHPNKAPFNEFFPNNNNTNNTNTNNNFNNNNSNNVNNNVNNANSLVPFNNVSNRTSSPPIYVHNLSNNNGSLSSTSSPSPSPSIDNGHNHFQQQLSNMVLNLSNQAAAPYHQVSFPLDVHLQLRHQYEMQQKLAAANQLPPVSPLTKKLLTELCSKRNALMDQSALIDAARYTENFLHVLLDDAALIAQHDQDPTDSSNQPACINASSLALALKLLPSKLLSSLQIYNKP